MFFLPLTAFIACLEKYDSHYGRARWSFSPGPIPLFFTTRTPRGTRGDEEMVKATSKVQRRLTKKFSHVQEGFSGEGAEAAAAAVLPEGSLAAPHLQTKRERLLARNLGFSHSTAPDASEAGHTEVGETAAPQNASVPSLQKQLLKKKKLARKAVKHSAAAESSSRAHGKVESGGDATPLDPAKSVQQHLKAIKASKAASGSGAASAVLAKDRARQAVASHGEARMKKARTRPERGGASARMAQVHEELNYFDKVLDVSAFKQDPLGAIEDHLTSTMLMLQPQTPDVGRAARP